MATTRRPRPRSRRNPRSAARSSQSRAEGRRRARSFPGRAATEANSPIWPPRSDPEVAPKTRASSTPLNSVSRCRQRAESDLISTWVRLREVKAPIQRRRHQEHDRPQPIPSADPGDDQGHEKIELLLDADAPQDAQRVVRDWPDQRHRPVPQEPEERSQMRRQQFAIAGRPQRPLSPGMNRKPIATIKQ